MFSRLSLKCFKAWRDTGDVPLSRVNLFLGSNSTGKSSLFQALLLLKQTTASPDRTIHLNLGGAETGDYVNLGDFSDVLISKSNDRMIEIALDFERRLREGEKPSAYQIIVQYRATSTGAPVVSFLKLSSQDRQFRAIRREKGAYSIYDGESDTPLGKARNYAPERSIAFPVDALALLVASGSQYSSNAVQDISLAVHRELEAIAYLGPLRRKPERDYSWNKVKPGTIGEDGADAIPALFAASELGNDDGMIEGISHWLSRMGIADKLEIQRIGRSTRYAIIVHRDGVAANLRDVGIGVSQVLPVLTLAYFAAPGSTVILEEPEIHLHPLAQSVLADLLVEVSAQREIQFFVETHSEHLFRRMQTLIAEQQLSDSSCRLYFVERKGADAVLRRLNVDRFGRVQNWPDRFFGDVAGETRRQALAAAQQLRQGGQNG